MDTDYGRLADDIARLEVMISRAKGALRDEGFADEWDKVVGLAVSILDRVDMDKNPTLSDGQNAD